MKKTIFLIAVSLVSGLCNGQIYTGVGIGMSTKAPIAELQVLNRTTYNFKPVFFVTYQVK